MARRWQNLHVTVAGLLFYSKHVQFNQRFWQGGWDTPFDSVGMEIPETIAQRMVEHGEVKSEMCFLVFIL